MQLKSLRIAHRGMHTEHIENTLEAFRAAYLAGCDMVEFDVQLSRDGVPVIFHDDDGLRLAGCREQIWQLDWAEISQLELRLSKDSGELFYRVPSLDQFLSEFGEREFYLEIKIPEAKKNAPEYYQFLGRVCAEKVSSAKNKSLIELGKHKTSGIVDTTDTGNATTFLASFHIEILRFLIDQQLYPRLAGIFEDYQSFDTASRDHRLTFTYYSVSWKIFKRYLETNIKIPAMANPSTAAVPTSKILIWNIFGKENFQKARALNVAGLVADNVELLIQN